MTFRFVLQPTLATLAALRDGVKDARAGRSPFLWTVLSNRAEWGGRLREGLISTARIILLGIAMYTICQIIVLKAFYPAEAAIIAFVLAVAPYVVLRRPIERVGRWRLGETSAGKVR
jgi:hypothetical protein